MEQQSGPGGWVSRIRQPSPKPGQMRLWTWQAIAHGADFVSYFRWRTAPVGTEIYWHGLLNYDNEPNRRLRELKKIAAETEKMAGLSGSRYQARIAMVKDYSNEWDSEQDNWRRQDASATMAGSKPVRCAIRPWILSTCPKREASAP